MYRIDTQTDGGWDIWDHYENEDLAYRGLEYARDSYPKNSFRLVKLSAEAYETYRAIDKQEDLALEKLIKEWNKMKMSISFEIIDNV